MKSLLVLTALALSTSIAHAGRPTRIAYHCDNFHSLTGGVDAPALSDGITTHFLKQGPIDYEKGLAIYSGKLETGTIFKVTVTNFTKCTTSSKTNNQFNKGEAQLSISLVRDFNEKHVKTLKCVCTMFGDG